ncbi:MAG: carboxypeptidase [Desulfuromonadales bacterium C00003096]|nr:MAG: carboxypeptidase [Desulfuromonadales bacterium C00003096]
MKLTELLSISGPTPISELTDEQLKELQRALSLLGYPVGDIDGLIGPKTRNAWSEFKTDVFPGNAALIGKESIETLQGKLDAIGEGKIHDFSSKDGTIEAIKWECRAQGIGLNTQITYVLATTQWETNQTFEPVREAYWLSENWRKNNLRYYPFYGRGFVQLTWKNNYEKYSRILGVDMASDPDIAMRPNVALFVLVHGFKTGTFTGRKITDYIDETKTDFVRARRCINGTDKAHEIADIAKKFLADL